MRNAVTIFAAPIEAFEHLKGKPRWATPFFLVLGGIVLMAWLKSCLRADSVVFDLTILIGTAIGSAIMILLVWFLFAAFVYFAASLLKGGHSLSYKAAVSIVSYSSLIFLLGEIVNFLLVRTELFDGGSYPVPNRFPIGLDIVLWGGEADLYLAVLLHSINLFTVWYLAILTIGISTVVGLSRAKSVGLVIAIWALGVGFVLGVVLVAGGTTVSITL